MRVLVADRNALLLESISRTFANRFSVRTATTHERCSELLRQGEFDVAVISEKLADGPGFALLAQIARDSPEMRRVLCVRQSRLQLLKGKLGPFGLFRTLNYPFGPRELLATLRLASVPVFDVPAPEVARVRVTVRAADRVTRRRPGATATSRNLSIGGRLPPAASKRGAPRSDMPRSAAAQRPATGPVAARSPQQMRVIGVPIRTQVTFGAGIVAVFLLTMLILNPDLAAPNSDTTAVYSTPIVRPQRSVAPRLEVKPVATQVHANPARTQVASNTVSVADPSTFGSEAYEPIYSDDAR